MKRDAILSECGRYRYLLWREWERSRKPMVFIMFNPSTADATEDDPTIRKCIGFARGLGYGGIAVANLYAYRATKPADLKAAGYPVGPRNDASILTACAAGAGKVVCAWGALGRGLARPSEVVGLIRAAGYRTMCLGTTDDGLPRHPLMLPYSTPMVPYDPC